MISKLKNPAVAIAFSLFLSVGMGVYLCVQAAGPMIWSSP